MIGLQLFWITTKPWDVRSASVTDERNRRSTHSSLLVRAAAGDGLRAAESRNLEKEIDWTAVSNGALPATTRGTLTDGDVQEVEEAALVEAGDGLVLLGTVVVGLLDGAVLGRVALAAGGVGDGDAAGGGHDGAKSLEDGNHFGCWTCW